MFGIVHTLVLGRVAFCAAAPACHRIKEERVDVDGTAGHLSRMIDQGTVHASSLDQVTLAHKSLHVCVLSHTQHSFQIYDIHI